MGQLAVQSDLGSMTFTGWPTGLGVCSRCIGTTSKWFEYILSDREKVYPNGHVTGLWAKWSMGQLAVQSDSGSMTFTGWPTGSGVCSRCIGTTSKWSEYILSDREKVLTDERVGS